MPSAELTEFERDRLIGSVVSRARQSSILAIALAALSGVFLMQLHVGVNSVALALWFGSMVASLFVRWCVSRWALRQVARGADQDLGGTQSAVQVQPEAEQAQRVPQPDEAMRRQTYDVARRFDGYFRGISLCTQFVVGAGMWLAYGVESPAAGYVLTLLVLFYGVGAMINLAHDAKTFSVSAPLLLGHPILFWLLQGVGGIALSVGSLLLLVLMIRSVRSSQAQFDEGIRMRHSKDTALQARDQANAELKVALDAAARADRAKGFFLATASHDLRQPIVAAALIGETLQKSVADDDAQRQLSDQGAMLREIQTMLDNMLDLARFEEGVVTAVLRPVPLEPLFAYLRLAHARACAERALRLDVPTVDLWVRTDVTLLQRMLINLLGNAVKYTERGNVGVHVERRGTEVVVSVSDTGRGISEADRQRMFEAFVRLPDSPEQITKGAGLGLAIVHGIAGVLQLELIVDSTLGAGTRISFALPVAQPDVEPVAVVEQLGLQNRLRGQVVWIVGAGQTLLRQLDPELLHLGCIFGVLADQAECQALHHDGEVPNFLIVDARELGQQATAELLAWVMDTFPQLQVLALTDGVGVSPIDYARAARVTAVNTATDGPASTAPTNAAMVHWLVANARSDITSK